MRRLLMLTLVLAATIGLALPRSGRAAERRPNVLLIAADDLAAGQSDKLKELLSAWQSWDAQLAKPLWGSSSARTASRPSERERLPERARNARTSGKTSSSG